VRNMRAIRKVAKSGQVSLPPEIIEVMGIEPGDIIEYEVIGIVKKVNAKMEKSGIENPQMATLEPISA